MTEKATKSRISGPSVAAIFVVLLVIVLAIIVGAWYWLLLSVPLIVVTFFIAMWSDVRTKPSAMLKALKAFFIYSTVGMLIVGVECAVFRDVNMYDSRVHWYEEHLGLLVEFIEKRLSLSFSTLVAATICLLLVESLFGWKTFRWFSSIRSLIGRASLILAVLTSFTFLNVKMIEGLKPGWLGKRTYEINTLIDDLGKKRRHELRLALVKEKVEKMTDDEKLQIANLLKASSQTAGDFVLVNTLAVDEGNGFEHAVAKDRRYTDQKAWSDTLPEEFSYHEIISLKNEDKEIEEKNKRTREAILELFKKGVSSFLPEELQPLLKEFADSLLDGAIDWTDERIFPERATGHEQFANDDVRWDLNKPSAELFGNIERELGERETARKEAVERARQREADEREAWTRWKEISKEMGTDVDHPREKREIEARP
jgi:hypothetical protein